VSTQQIRYRDGLATFDIPAHWSVEIDPDTGGEFYDPAGTAALRLTVMTFQGPEGSWQLPPPSPDKRALGAGTFPNGCAFTVTEHDSVEGGVPIRIRTWTVSQIRGGSVHVYVFTYTHEQDDPGAPEAVAGLARTIRAMTPCPGHHGTDLCLCSRINAVQIKTGGY
jgi:hypothetical protein